MATDIAHEHLQSKKMLKKQRQLSGYDSSSPEDEEEDETFLTLQKLLKSLNNTRAPNPPAPLNEHSTANRRRMGNVPTTSTSANDQPRLSQEEQLEARRQERERFRHLLFASKSARRRRQPAYYVQSEDDEEEEEPVPSVESAISNRVISGSFSRLNVHVVSRDRWTCEEAERLPIVLLPKDGKYASPADNPKLNVCRTNEFEDLHDQLLDQLKKMPEMIDTSRLLTPPQSTWYMQMRDMDGIQC